MELFTPASNTIRNDQTDYYNLLYTGPIYMGSNREMMNVIWDTGSFVYLGETHLCAACDVPKYDFTDELGSSFSYLSGSYTETYMDGTTMTGSWATDWTCITNDDSTCVRDFTWVAISTASGLSVNEDGIVGMGYSHTTDGHSDIIYVPELFKAGVITENVFSFLITGDANTTGNSYIDFGTPDTSVMTSVNDITWIPSTNVGGWWTSNITGWRYSGSTTEIGLESTWGLTDTGTSCLYGPSSVLNTIIADATAAIVGTTSAAAGWGILFNCA